MSQNDTEQSNMDRLREALKAGLRVEIDLHMGGVSGSFSAARESAQDAAEANSRGERVVRIIGVDGEREFECGANAAEVQELLRLGAVEL
jgi:hypothetical protein